MMKRCYKCNIIKDDTHYHKDKRKKDGLTIYCKECRKIIDREYSQRPEVQARNIPRHREYYKNNKESIRKQRIEKCKTDYQFYKASYLRKTIHELIFVQKSDTKLSLSILGCTLKIARDHLESQFKEGMSWENRGEWHIDHIIPFAAFDMTNEEEIKKCCHYTNMQPLWAIENYKKGTHILHDNK